MWRAAGEVWAVVWRVAVELGGLLVVLALLGALRLCSNKDTGRRG